jgi:hypothetical protein
MSPADPLGAASYLGPVFADDKRQLGPRAAGIGPISGVRPALVGAISEGRTHRLAGATMGSPGTTLLE